MLKSAMEKLLSLAKMEERETSVVQYGNYTERKRTAYFDESNGSHKIIDFSRINRQVSNIDSFLKAVVEETRRRNNPTGEKMSVVFTIDGGVYHINDDFSAGSYSFQRALSAQWLYLTENLDEYINHEGFITLIQTLYPSMNEDEYDNVINAFRSIRYVKESKLTANPVRVREQDEVGSDLVESFKIKFGDESLNVPVKFTLKMPYTKASDYEVYFEVVIQLSAKNDEPYFRLIFPEMETKIEEAIKYEVDFFNKQIQEKEISDLLILEDY